MEGPPGEQGPPGEPGDRGLPGDDGATGTNGIDGVSCWDLDESRACDLLSEDLNGDEACDVLDCHAGEVDPHFALSDAATITSEDLASWTEAAAWGDHAVAGYLTVESDPAFAASPAAGITQPDIDGWLTTESDPVFSSSIAADIQPTDVNEWNAAYAWGNHAVQGYITSETDPQVGVVGDFRPCRGDGSVRCTGDTLWLTAEGSAEDNGRLLLDVIDALPATFGGVVVLDPGLWTTAETVDLPSGVDLQGSGRGTTTIDATMLQINGGSSEVRELTLVHRGEETPGIGCTPPGGTGNIDKKARVSRVDYRDTAVDPARVTSGIINDGCLLELNEIDVISLTGQGVAGLSGEILITTSDLTATNRLDVILAGGSVDLDPTIKVRFSGFDGQVSGHTWCFGVHDENFAAYDDECR